MTPSPSERATTHWPTLGVIAIGVLLLLSMGSGVLHNVVANPAGSMSAASPAASGTPVTNPAAVPTASPAANTSTTANTGGDQGGPADAAISSITQRIIHTNPILAQSQGPGASESVFDPYRLLTPDQLKSLTVDVNRLRAAGLPTLVYIRISLNDQQQSQAFAQSLIEKPGLVESTAGAQDGLVVLVSVPPGTAAKGNIAIAYGKNALPVNGLDVAAIRRIYEQGMVPRLLKGQVGPALQYGLREFNYVIAYTPYSTPVLSSTARTTGRILNVAAPLLALLGIAIVAVTWIPTGAERWPGVPGAGGRRWLPAWWPSIFAGALAAVLIPLAVYARTRLGIFAAAALLGAVLLDVWVTTDRPRRRRARRTITVTSAFPSRVAARRQTVPNRKPIRHAGHFRGPNE